MGSTGMTPRGYGTEGRERAFLPLTLTLSRKGRGRRKGRGSKVRRAASHAASSLRVTGRCADIRGRPCYLRGAFFLTSIRNGVPSNPKVVRIRFSKYRR